VSNRCVIQGETNESKESEAELTIGSEEATNPTQGTTCLLDLIPISSFLLLHLRFDFSVNLVKPGVQVVQVQWAWLLSKSPRQKGKPWKRPTEKEGWQRKCWIGGQRGRATSLPR